MELKLIIICAECKQHIGTVLKAENQEAIEALLKLADSSSEKIVWHNLNHGRQVYAVYDAGEDPSEFH